MTKEQILKEFEAKFPIIVFHTSTDSTKEKTETLGEWLSELLDKILV